MGVRKIPKTEGYTDIQVVSYVRMRLSIDADWAIKACLVLNDKQTKKEKKLHNSTSKNNYGFTKFDAPLLAFMAEKLAKTKDIPKEDILLLKTKMVKYARQLICISYDKNKQDVLIKHLDDYYHYKEVPY